MSKLLVFQVDGMDGSNEEADAWIKFADIASNARIANEVEFFMQAHPRPSLCSVMPGATEVITSDFGRVTADIFWRRQASSSAETSASKLSGRESEARSEIREGSPNNEPQGALRAVPDASGVFEERESGAAAGGETAPQFTDAGGWEDASGFELNPVTAGHIARLRALPDPAVTAKRSPDVIDPGSRLPRPSPELDSDGAEADVTEGSISPEGRDLTRAPSEKKSTAPAMAETGGCPATTGALTSEGESDATELMMLSGFIRRSRILSSGR